MIITQSIPNGLRAPGIYSETAYEGNPGGLVTLKQRICIIAEKLAAGTAAVNVPIKVESVDDADAKLGKGSYAAILVRTAKAQAAYQGAEPEIYVCPLLEPAGTKNARTLTYTVSSPKAGNHSLRVGRFTVVVGVSASDTPTTLALKVKAELDKLTAVVPITVTVALGVVTCTFTTQGVNGNDLAYAHIESPAGVSVVIATGTAGTGAAPIATALDALYDQVYDAVPFSNHTTVDAAAWLVDAAKAWAPGNELPRWGVFGETGTIGTAQTLQAALNDYRSIIVSCEQSPALPGELAVCVAIAAWGKNAPNAGLNSAALILPAPPANLAYTTGDAGEIETLLESGITPLRPNGTGLCMIVRLVTTTKTVNGVVFEGTRDLAYSRTASYMARQIAIGFASGKFDQRTFDADYILALRKMVIGKHRAAEDLGYILNVDDFIDLIKVEESTSSLGRAMLEDPFQVAGPAHQVFARHVMYFPVA